MNLTTLARVKERIGGMSSDKFDKDDLVRRLIVNVSGMIERYLARKIEKKSYTEIFDLSWTKRRYLLEAYPVASITSVHIDLERKFEADSLVDADEYELKPGLGLVILDTPSKWSQGVRVLKTVYVGGMAKYTEQLDGVIESLMGVFTAGETIEGQTNGAKAKLISQSGTAISIQVQAGFFAEGEQLKGLTSAATCTLKTITELPLVLSHPHVVEAAEIQIAHNWKRRDNPGAVATSAGGGSVTMEKELNLIGIVKDMLALEKRKLV